jgi:hypothetical protein
MTLTPKPVHVSETALEPIRQRGFELILRECLVWHGFRRRLGSQANSDAWTRVGLYASKLSRPGHASGARMQAGSVFGPPQFGPRRMPTFSGSMPAGLRIPRSSIVII